ncbi:MAG TPA: hypothetical protein VFA62_08830 [Acidimicrobiia bacterium]|nr:hypothetical protein [Acidimicrobiia bacterium]
MDLDADSLFGTLTEEHGERVVILSQHSEQLTLTLLEAAALQRWLAEVLP